MNCEKCGKPAYRIKIADKEIMLCSDCLARLLQLVDIFLGVKMGKYATKNLS